MPLKKILFKPGINRENTRYTTEGGWYDGDKIRFRQGTPEKIGGWNRISSASFLGICRSLWNWVTLGSLNLIGVGYKAQAQANKLNLSVGYSHPVDIEMPAGIKVETPTQTEIVISGADRQTVGQVAAEVRAFRPPEPYKGKGIRYVGERVVIKETKKK
jgi:hypothetical protein